MAQYLIDVNLPYYFALWRNDKFIHQIDINPKWKDKQIWEYAKENNLTIISKDSDFSNRILLNQPPPKVIPVRTGNLDMNKFSELISNCWNDVLRMTEQYKLVNIYNDRIEGVQ